MNVVMALIAVSNDVTTHMEDFDVFAILVIF